VNSISISKRSTTLREVSIAIDGIQLEGTLAIPKDAAGIVLFVHGSGSSRHSTRNRFVAGELQSHGIGTLLFDLLTPDEEIFDRATAEYRFDIRFLADRLIGATRWAMSQPDLRSLRIGFFGASTGAAAALVAAAELTPDAISAVVSRGGRPDLAGDALSSVQTPTLLIVGGNDEPVIGMNREALDQLHCSDKKLVIVPGATHLFEEPGTLEKVADLAAEWFTQYLQIAPSKRSVSSARS
jgi:putative phosphoribosyl transferase